MPAPGNCLLCNIQESLNSTCVVVEGSYSRAGREGSDSAGGRFGQRQLWPGGVDSKQRVGSNRKWAAQLSWQGAAYQVKQKGILSCMEAAQPTPS